MKAVADQYRLPAPHNCPPALHSLMLQCWQADRGDRPAFDSLLSSLDRLIRHPASLKAEPTRWDGKKHVRGRWWRTISFIYGLSCSCYWHSSVGRSCSQPLLSPTPTDLSSVATVSDWLKALRMERYQDEFDQAHLDTLDRVSMLTMEWVQSLCNTCIWRRPTAVHVFICCRKVSNQCSHSRACWADRCRPRLLPLWFKVLISAFIQLGPTLPD